MSVVLGAAALLLLAAGAAKVADPRTTSGALAALDLPSSPPLVRVGAAGEALVGAAALVVTGPVPALLVAASYVAFAAFVALALRAGTPVGTCGCWGRPDTEPSPTHVALDAALAAGAMAAAAGGADPLLTASPLAAVAAAGLAGLAYLAFTRGP